MAALIIVSLNLVLPKARDARRKADINEIVKALDMFYLDKGSFPFAGNSNYPPGWSNSGDGSWNSLASQLEPYINPLPKDPVNNTNCWSGDNNYCYVYDYAALNYGCGDDQAYMLVYTLENKSDPALSQSPGVTLCDGDNFNYSGTITIGEVKK